MLPRVYFETRFRVAKGIQFPAEFAIISAYATTGEIWTDEQNQSADHRLRSELEAFQVWMERVVGYSPTTQHAEPSWAVAVPFDQGCSLGHRFLQDAIYYVTQDRLQVANCSDREPVFVDLFQNRLDYGTT